MGKSKEKRRRLRRIYLRKQHEWNERQKRIDEHHLIPRSRKGPSNTWNILLIKKYRHNAWHALFDLPGGRPRTLDEIIALLLRIRAAKAKQRNNRIVL